MPANFWSRTLAGGLQEYGDSILPLDAPINAVSLQKCVDTSQAAGLDWQAGGIGGDQGLQLSAQQMMASRCLQAADRQQTETRRYRVEQAAARLQQGAPVGEAAGVGRQTGSWPVPPEDRDRPPAR